MWHCITCQVSGRIPIDLYLFCLSPLDFSKAFKGFFTARSRMSAYIAAYFCNWLTRWLIFVGGRAKTSMCPDEICKNWVCQSILPTPHQCHSLFPLWCTISEHDYPDWRNWVMAAEDMSTSYLFAFVFMSVSLMLTFNLSLIAVFLHVCFVSSVSPSFFLFCLHHLNHW